MVFIELARVSEILAPHKFDRSIDFEQFSTDRLPSNSEFPAFYVFLHENYHFSLNVLQKRKNTKTNQNIRK
jgi:hypothetical protein